MDHQLREGVEETFVNLYEPPSYKRVTEVFVREGNNP